VANCIRSFNIGLSWPTMRTSVSAPLASFSISPTTLQICQRSLSASFLVPPEVHSPLLGLPIERSSLSPWSSPPLVFRSFLGPLSVLSRSSLGPPSVLPRYSLSPP
jgi:hypothetical protein